ncbi:helix-turn-helix transcriptional regulator [Pseudomonas inefficax]|uniref:helix-turn-helix transcriptional regulator n=1 Tax=Pseudomonas inefficax TaxID=2078786 RepID=UPI002DBB3BFB|nr:AraC family transcriptional regulator [Pseudomonas sp. CMAA1741]MEC4560825.1 AraC family transcriptional regulator [Pseudomonas sp. CMAA1741]
MRSISPYLDTAFSFDSPGSLAEAGVLDASSARVMGSATGHYRAQTVHGGLQYFDCNLQFPEPLRIDKVLQQSLCIVQVFDGAWQHTVDGRLNSYAPGQLHMLGLGESLEAQDQLPANSHARMAGVRIAGDYLHELARDDAQLMPLLALAADGMRFDQLPQWPTVSRLFQQLYLSPYTGALRRLHCESLSLAIVLELASHLIGHRPAEKPQDRGHRDLAIETRRQLDANLNAPPTAATLARQLGVSETTLRRAFSHEYGRSLLQYVRQQRMELARALLLERRWQVSQVAYQVGYANPANFCHAYKAYFGRSPGAE